jgi:DNA repair protein RecO (recombination protein O)
VVLAYFQWRLVEHVGLLGRMEGCAGCGQAVGQVGVCFSSAAGGLLCHDCQGRARDRRPVPPQALAGLKALAAAAGRRTRLPEAQAAAVNALLAYHIQYQLGRRLKTAPLVLKDHWGGG